MANWARNAMIRIRAYFAVGAFVVFSASGEAQTIPVAPIPTVTVEVQPALTPPPAAINLDAKPEGLASQLPPPAALKGGLAANQLPLPATLKGGLPANQLPLPDALKGDLVAAQPPIPPPTHPENMLPPPNFVPKPVTLREPEERFREDLGLYPEAAFGSGKWCWTGWRYGPCVAPPWEYPGLGGGPKVSYPWGMPGYSGCRNGEESQDRWRFWGPQVPIYTPVPQPVNPGKLIYPGRNISSPGFVYGWVGPFPASPRFKHYAVNVWAQPGVDLSTGGGKETNRPPGESGSSATMSINMRVPDPAAEVYVDGVKTSQTGVDRSFNSPDLAAGQQYRYEVTVRWTEQGVPRQGTRIVVGAAGDKVALDFTAPDAAQAASAGTKTGVQR